MLVYTFTAIDVAHCAVTEAVSGGANTAYWAIDPVPRAAASYR